MLLNRRCWCAFLFYLFLCLHLFVRPAAAATNGDSSSAERRLNEGSVIVDITERNKIKFVVGRILIAAPPEKVWPILVNPYEFAGKISPRMKNVEVLVDQSELSVLRCNFNVCFPLPEITYTVESRYVPGDSVEFRRVSGVIKDFKGRWALKPRNGGRTTEVIYSMFIDPGFAVPHWIVREAVKVELPRTLTALRQRVNRVVGGGVNAESRSIEAVRYHFGHNQPTI